VPKRSLALAFVFLGLAALAAEPATTADEGSPSVLVQRKALAASKRFYLELDLSRKEIRLCHTGATLAVYPVASVEVGFPRRFFLPRRSDDLWIGRTWSQGHLDPPAELKRIRIVPGDEATAPTPGKAEVIPPTLDDLIPVPPRFRILFDGGRVLLVELTGEVPGALMATSPWKIRWREFQEGLGLKPSDPLRVRLRLDAATGAALYRSFPADPPDLLVVP